MFTRERAIGIMVALLLGVVAFVYGLRSLEWHMTFHPVPLDRARWQPPSGASEEWFTTADGIRLHGWYFESNARPETPTIIFFHGNTGNIQDVGWLGQRFHERGFNVLLFDYRGYGASEGDVENETGLNADGDAALAFVIKEKGISPRKIVLYGQSLGTTVVADVASRRDVGAAILESGLSSASSLAGHALPWLPQPLHFLGKNRFESAQKLAKVRAPVLIAHGDPDPVIPASEARLLFEAASEPKHLLIFPGAGHNVFGSLGDSYLNQLVDFIGEATVR
ncbi:MAG TPA: alpha/beta hydrolase [Pyrinomonadaceae bacterium]|nr:alpha/beta hydrolase [Pyrinomonadaceae bacterium]